VLISIDGIVRVDGFKNHNDWIIVVVCSICDRIVLHKKKKLRRMATGYTKGIRGSYKKTQSC